MHSVILFYLIIPAGTHQPLQLHLRLLTGAGSDVFLHYTLPGFAQPEPEPVQKKYNSLCLIVKLLLINTLSSQFHVEKSPLGEIIK